MDFWSAVDWIVVRASGFTAYSLLCCSVITGLLLSLHWQSPTKWPRLINNELHNFLTLLSLIFTLIHVLFTWIDPYTHFGWDEVFIPFITSYRTTGMASGIVALYLGAAVGISTWVRPYIGYSWWRRIHILTFLVYLIALLHSIVTGSDTKTLWGMALYMISACLVGALLVIRLSKLLQKKDSLRSSEHVQPAMVSRARKH